MIPVLNDIKKEFVSIICSKDKIYSDNMKLAIATEGKPFFEKKNKTVNEKYDITSKSNIEDMEHIRDLLIINKICPMCKKNNVLHSFEYTSHYEFQQEYLGDFCLKIYCADCLFLEEFELDQCLRRITEYDIPDIKNTLWAQYVNLWKFWNFELLCGSTCPVCDTFICCNHKDNSNHTNQYICTNSECNFYEYYNKYS